MKKIGLLTTLCFIFLLTGCSKSLTCTRSDDTTKEIVSFKFNSKEVLTNGQVKYEIKVADESAIDEAKEMLKSSFNEAFKGDGYTLKITDNKKDTVIVTLDFDAKKISETNDLTENASYEAVKEKMKQNYTCN